MDILIVGSVAFDTIKTPFGQADDALGGSATYFSLSARHFAKPHVVAVVGEDFSNEHLSVFERHNIGTEGLAKEAGKTFRWGGEYGFDLNNRTTLFTELNVFERFAPRLPESHRSLKHVFLGNIHPALQLQVLDQIPSPEVVGLDTMNFWIEKTRPELLEVLKRVNIFIINDSEARELSGEHNLVKSAKKILGMMDAAKNPALIIKRGEYGLVMFAWGSNFFLPGFPLEDVFDPTGAGDSFAGGFMGYLAQCGNLSWDGCKQAAVFGSVTASFCVEKMGTKRLEEITIDDIKNRFKDFKHLTHFDEI